MRLRSGKTYNRKKIIILDLDKTLIHSINTNMKKYGRIRKNIGDFYILNGSYLVFKRPYVDKFIRYCFQNFNKVIVWSSGTREYVNEIVKKLFKPKYKPVMVLTRDNCSVGYYKDVKIIKKKFKFDKIYFLEDKPNVVKNLNSENIISIKPFRTNC